jgi:hypothetical protein
MEGVRTVLLPQTRHQHLSTTLLLLLALAQAVIPTKEDPLLAATTPSATRSHTMASTPGAMQQSTNLEIRTRSSTHAGQVPEEPLTEDREMADETPIPATADQAQNTEANPNQPQPGARAHVLAGHGSAQITQQLPKGVFKVPATL